MILSFQRWLTIIAMGCAAIAAAFLPAEHPSYWEGEWHQRQIRQRDYAWQMRAGARAQHTSELLIAYRAQSDKDLARRTFAARAGVIGDPEVVFAADVSPGARAGVLRALEWERAQRGEWRGHGKVGLIVLNDTATTMDGQEITPLTGRSWPLRFRPLPASAATGDRCVTILRLRRGYGDTRIAPNTNQPLLDACAFFDAFGAPGAQIDRVLRASNFELARGYRRPQFESAPSIQKFVLANYGSLSQYRLVPSLACRAGGDSACLALTQTSEVDIVARQSSFWLPNVGVFRNPGGELSWWWSETSHTFDALANDLGPARFAKVWSSPKPLADAYFDVSGERLAQWSRRREERVGGAYRAGPTTPAGSTALTLLAIIALAAVATRFAPRPDRA